MAKEEQEDILGKTYEQLTEYVDLRVQLAKAELTEKTAKISGFMISVVVLCVAGFFFLLFLSIMAGFYFSRLFDDMFYGFGIIAAFYAVLLLAGLLFRRTWIESPVINKVISMIYEKDETREDN